MHCSTKSISMFFHTIFFLLLTTFLLQEKYPLCVCGKNADQNITVPTINTDGQKAHNKGYVAFCATIKDEGVYLREWVVFHHALGVSKFYLLDDKSVIPQLVFVADFVSSGVVEFISDKQLIGINVQLATYDFCISQYRHMHRFMAFLDVDEYIVIKDQAVIDLPNLLRRYEQFGGLALNWMYMGSSDHYNKPPGPMINNYRNCFSSTLIKSIVNLQHVVKASSTPHDFIYSSGFYAVDLLGHKVLRYHNPIMNSTNNLHNKLLNVSFIQHYVVKSREDFLGKSRRTQFNNATRDMAYFETVNSLSTHKCESLVSKTSSLQHYAQFAPQTFCHGLLDGNSFNPNISLRILDALRSQLDYIDGFSDITVEAFRHYKTQMWMTLVDVDDMSFSLFANQMLFNQFAGTRAIVIAVSYNETVCPLVLALAKKLKQRHLILCYYNANWVDRLERLWGNLTVSDAPPSKLHLVTLGRVFLVQYLGCRGYNVLTVDADSISFRNIHDYVLRNADVMFAADRIRPLQKRDKQSVWDSGIVVSPFYDRMWSLNTGIWYFHAEGRDSVKRFVVDFGAIALKSITPYPKGPCDPQRTGSFCGEFRKAFHQLSLNGMLLKKYPFKIDVWNSETNTGGRNIAGECCDCFFGTWRYPFVVAPYTSVITSAASAASYVNSLNVGIFPTYRFSSAINHYLNNDTVDSLQKMSIDAIHYIEREVETHRGVPRDKSYSVIKGNWYCSNWDGNSYPNASLLLLHANGLAAAGMRYDLKKQWMKKHGVWLLNS